MMVRLVLHPYTSELWNVIGEVDAVEAVLFNKETIGIIGEFLDSPSLLDRLNKGIPIETEIRAHAWVVADSKMVRNKELVNWTQGKRLFGR